MCRLGTRATDGGPVVCGRSVRAGLGTTPAPAIGAVLMSASTVVVAIDARLVRRMRLQRTRQGMDTCCHREGLEREFGRKTAERELRRFRRRGPIPSTRLLVEDLLKTDLDDVTLLDIGGGIGAIHHRLLDAGARAAVHVDVSPEYLRTARDEAARLGHAERVRFRRGDFVQLAPQLDEADVVTLDRVICCYPEMEPLVASAAGKARRSLGAVYPREEWWMRAGIALANALMWLRRSPFRVFLHPPAAIDAVLRDRGLERRSARRTLAWEIVVYARAASLS